MEIGPDFLQALREITSGRVQIPNTNMFIADGVILSREIFDALLDHAARDISWRTQFPPVPVIHDVAN